MADCYITSTGSYLPGDPIDNQSIDQYLGEEDLPSLEVPRFKLG